MELLPPEARLNPDSGSDLYECFTDSPTDSIRSGLRPVLEVS
jgi:hypothetical protein